MKHWKRLLAIAAAVVLAMAMAAPAYAEGEGDEGGEGGGETSSGYTISVNSTDTHTYKVYQVLTGTLANATAQNLGDPTWGSSVIENPGDVDEFIADITASGLTDAQIAAKVAEKVDLEKPVGEVKAGTSKSGLAAGYYALVDVTDLSTSEGGHQNDTKSIHVIKVVQNIDGFTIKYDTTSNNKKIVGDTLGEEGNTYADGVSADNVSVGDTVDYQITAKVPAKASDYNYFYFIINDTLSDGLTLDADSIKVYHGSVAEANKLGSGAYTLRTATTTPAVESPKDFQVGLNNAIEYAGEDIIVTYSAVLNEGAVIGDTTGNSNTSTVTFSNDPNHNYDGKNNPGFPGDGEDGTFGETPESTTKTYTTGIEIQKVDENGNALTGATFKISGDSTKKVITVAEAFVEDAEGPYYKLKDGTYTKTAPTAEGDYMKEAESGATEGYVEDSSYNGDDKVVVDGKTYRPYVPETDQGKTIYTKVTGNGHLYDSTTTKYKKTETKAVSDATTSHEAEQAVSADGLARFDGLGAGTYTIEETVVPGGYNKMTNLTVTVSFDDNNTPKWTFSGGTGGYDQQEGIYKIKVENNKGSELPSTGGMGTTILYVIGGIMVLLAAVFLITKRRVAASKNDSADSLL